MKACIYYLDLYCLQKEVYQSECKLKSSLQNQPIEYNELIDATLNNDVSN